MQCITDKSLDTDLFGTFTGDVERKIDPLAAAREKCQLAMELSGCDMAIASEGSFGAHPSIFFASADEELLVFIDKKNDLEIVARELSLETNFASRVVSNEQELLDFADSVKFPSHALILRKSRTDFQVMKKGVIDFKELKESFRLLNNDDEGVYVETDMRAMFNPSRMLLIEKLAKKLLKRIKSTCPNCLRPGFGVTDIIKGLPCSLCGSATNSTLSYVNVCSHCKLVKYQKYPHRKKSEDPMYCDFCNP